MSSVSVSVSQLPAPFSFVQKQVEKLVGEADPNVVAIGLHVGGNLHQLRGECDETARTFDISTPLVQIFLHLESTDSVSVRYVGQWQSIVLLAEKEQELSLLTDQLVGTTDQLVSLYNLSKGSPSSVEPADLLRYLLDKIVEVIECDALLLVQPTGSQQSRGDRLFYPDLQACWDKSVDSGLCRSEETEAGINVLVGKFSECTSGGLVVCTRQHITTQYRKLFDTVFSYVDGVLALSELHKVEIQNAVLNRDIEMASVLADQVMPKGDPQVSGLDVAARCQYARLASGDFYTYIKTPYGLLAAVGDVSGKGLPAALVMTMVSTALAIASNQVQEANPAEVVRLVTGQMYEYLSSAGVFVTLGVATWDMSAETMSVCNAGHSPFLVVSDAVRSIKPSAPPLGIVPESAAEVEQVALAQNDFLLLGSDGLAEQENIDGVQLGYETVEHVVSGLRGERAETIVSDMFSMVESYGQGMSQDDDRTVLVLRRVDGAEVTR